VIQIQCDDITCPSGTTRSCMPDPTGFICPTGSQLCQCSDSRCVATCTTDADCQHGWPCQYDVTTQQYECQPASLAVCE
jgi:hypothetical protein